MGPDIRQRARLLRAMDDVARSINDEDIVEIWLMGGVPDGADDDELECIAEDDEGMRDVADCFMRVVSLAKDNGGLFWM